MKQGVVLFAHNNENTDYYKMAVLTARRVNRFLDLPVTVITDPESVTDANYTFDQTIFLEPDTTNRRKKSNWFNKGRYNVFELTPYEQTVVLDTDYLVNSQKLLGLFDLPSDFVCHNNTFWLGKKSIQERLNPNSEMGISTAWATVMRFDRTNRSKQIFDMIKMVQNNYEHYSQIYNFLSQPYRNDYALTIALKTVSGHINDSSDFIPWALAHVDIDITVHRESDTQYLMIISDKWGDKKTYQVVRDFDFHMLSKQNFLELM